MSMAFFADDVLFLQRFLKCCGFYEGELDGDWGSKTDKAVVTFEHICDDIALEHGRFDSMTERHARTLQPKAQKFARIFMGRLRDAGIEARIISGTRTYAQQEALYAKGRTMPGRRVTNARGGHSNHNFGIAWDIGIFDHGAYLGESPLYDRAAEAGLVPGIEWGGHWRTFKDRPHYQLGVNSQLALIRGSFEQGLGFVMA
jgi:peptidoglycan L-alanyl-D-glutamate endopeptidase CwlK